MIKFRTGRIMTAVVTAATGVMLALGPAGSAHAASTPLNSGFEAGDGSSWQFTRSGPGASFVSFGNTHSGARKATLTMFGAGFASAGHRLVAPSGTSGCTASAFIANPQSATRQLNFEVIDPATFRYIALRQLTFTTTTPYQFRALSWNKPMTQSQDVLLRFSVIGRNGATTEGNVDDVKVTCA
jgi:hypothetical protein